MTADAVLSAKVALGALVGDRCECVGFAIFFVAAVARNDGEIAGVWARECPFLPEVSVAVSAVFACVVIEGFAILFMTTRTRSDRRAVCVGMGELKSAGS